MLHTSEAGKLWILLEIRISNPKSSKYSLGWIPFKGGHAKYTAGQIQFAGHKFSLWDSYGLSNSNYGPVHLAKTHADVGTSMWLLK